MWYNILTFPRKLLILLQNVYSNYKLKLLGSTGAFMSCFMFPKFFSLQNEILDHLWMLGLFLSHLILFFPKMVEFTFSLMPIRNAVNNSLSH